MLIFSTIRFFFSPRKPHQLSFTGEKCCQSLEKLRKHNQFTQYFQTGSQARSQNPRMLIMFISFTLKFPVLHSRFSKHNRSRSTIARALCHDRFGMGLQRRYVTSKQRFTSSQSEDAAKLKVMFSNITFSSNQSSFAGRSQLTEKETWNQVLIILRCKERNPHIVECVDGVN